MKYICLFLSLGLLLACQSEKEPETTPEPEVVKWSESITLPAKRTPQTDAYDPELPVPYFDRESGLWGFITREKREQITPFMFHRVSRVQHGYALAMEKLDSGRVDIHIIHEDGTWGKIFEGSPEYDAWNGDLEPIRTLDNTFFIRQNPYFGYYNAQGEVLWDTICYDWKVMAGAGGFPAYMGKGHTALVINGRFHIRDSNFQTVKVYDTLQYGIQCPTFREWDDCFPDDALAPIIDSKARKMGMIDYKGDIVVPIEWDIPPGFYYGCNTDFNRGSAGEAMLVSQDSVFWAYRDSSCHLVHVNNGLLYTFPDTLLLNRIATAYNAKYGLLAARDLNGGGYALIDIKKNKKIKNGDRFTFLNPDLIHESVFFSPGEKGILWAIETDGTLKKVMDSDAMIVSFERNWRPLWTCYNKSEKVSLIDSTGKVLLPFEYDGGYVLRSYSDYPMAYLYNEDSLENKHYFYFNSYGRYLGGPIQYEDGGGRAINVMNSDNWLGDSFETAMIFLVFTDDNGFHRGFIDLLGNCYID